MADPTGLRCQRNTRMLNPAPKNVGGRVPKPSLILTLSPQGCDEGRGLYRWPETTNIFIPTRDGRENIINVQILMDLINAKNEEGAVIFLDQEKAFDMVSFTAIN